MHVFHAEVTFISKAEGGRSTPPQLNLRDYSYRPHIVLGDPNQRKAITDGYQVTEAYISTALRFHDEEVEFNKPFIAKLVLPFPLPEYENTIVTGATFTIREGGAVVGYGTVTNPPTLQV